MPEARYFCPIFPLGEYFDLTFWTLVSPILPPAEINHEETNGAKKEKKKTFALFVSSWLIFIFPPRHLSRLAAPTDTPEILCFGRARGRYASGHRISAV